MSNGRGNRVVLGLVLTASVLGSGCQRDAAKRKHRASPAQQARQALSKKVEQLVHDLASAPPRRSWQIHNQLKALGAAATPHLLRLARAEPLGLRRAAVRAMTAVPPPSRQAVPLLRALLGTDDAPLQYAAVQALAAQGSAAQPATAELRSLMAAPQDNTREAAIRLLARQSPKQALEGLTENLEHKNPDVRAAAARGLARLKQAQPAVAPLRRRCIEDQAPYVRKEACAALSTLGQNDPGSREMLVRAMADPFPGVRVAAITALAASKREMEPVPRLLAARLSDKHGRVREQAAKELAAMGARARPAVKELTATLSDSEHRTRAAAALALGHLGKDARPAIPALQRTLGDGRPYVGQNAAEALAELAPALPRARTVLHAAIKSNNADVRRAAVFGLRKLGREGLPELQAALGDSVERVRVAARQAVAALGPGATSPAPAAPASPRTHRSK